MILEGLEHRSAEDILDDVASVGFNFIRAGYAIEMVDQIYDNNGTDVSIEQALIAALGQENGTAVTQGIVKNNPSFTAQSTRFDVFSHVAQAMADRGIYLHPDVHVGKAQWCCSHEDGNSWFDDLNFPADQWRRGLSYIATWAKNHTNVVSMSLRNELRESWNVTTLECE
jgi:endoglucanase